MIFLSGNNMENRIQEEMKIFVRNYSIKTYKEDYNITCDLTYKYPVSKNRSRKYIKLLRNHLKSKGIFCDGIVVFEYNRSMDQLHNHILMYCKNEKHYKIHGTIFNFWKNYGFCRVEKYDKTRRYSEYICKYINITENQNWEFIMNL